EHIDAINQIFTELELAYHNQFRRAFPDATQLGMAKQLWLHSLCDLSPARLRAGVRRALKDSEFLPSLHTLRRYSDPSPQELRSEHIDAINQIFTELELAYHNQFRRAFPDATQLGMAKQLWLHSLCDLSPARLRAGVRRALKDSEFLPSLHTLRRYSDPSPQEL